MDLMKELENLVDAASAPAISDSDIELWQKLFGYSEVEARRHLESYRNNILRERLDDDQWELISATAEARGYNREAYDYFLTLGPEFGQTRSMPQQLSADKFLVELSRPISIDTLQDVLGPDTGLDILTGQGTHDDTSFCKIDFVSWWKLSNWLSSEHPDFRPTIVRLSKASKELSTSTLAPFVGYDVTMPQFRPVQGAFVPLPKQKQYPVCYFLYGNLAVAAELRHLLDLQEDPQYKTARVYGAKLLTWRGLYRAVVTGDMDQFVDGKAFWIRREQEEEAMQFYMTEKYEVVRCRIHISEECVNGLVFRFTTAKELE